MAQVFGLPQPLYATTEFTLALDDRALELLQRWSGLGSSLETPGSFQGFGIEELREAAQNTCDAIHWLQECFGGDDEDFGV